MSEFRVTPKPVTDVGLHHVEIAESDFYKLPAEAQKLIRSYGVPQRASRPGHFAFELAAYRWAEIGAAISQAIVKGERWRAEQEVASADLLSGLATLGTTMSGDRLFIGIYPAGIVYADRTRSQNGDYANCAWLSYKTLELSFAHDCPKDLYLDIVRHAVSVQRQRGQPFAIDQSGNTVVLGQ